MAKNKYQQYNFSGIDDFLEFINEDEQLIVERLRHLIFLHARLQGEVSLQRYFLPSQPTCMLYLACFYSMGENKTPRC